MDHDGMDSDILCKDLPKPFGLTVHRLNHTYLYTNRAVNDPYIEDKSDIKIKEVVKSAISIPLLMPTKNNELDGCLTANNPSFYGLNYANLL